MVRTNVSYAFSKLLEFDQLFWSYDRHVDGLDDVSENLLPPRNSTRPVMKIMSRVVSNLDSK